MKRTTFDERNDQVPHSGSDLTGYMPCGSCQLATLKATLSQFGNRCSRCYEDFGAAAFAPQPARYDTVQQAEMRKRLKTWSPAPNVLNRSDAEVDTAAREKAKAEAARKVAEYERHHSREAGRATRAGDSGSQA